MKVLYLFRSSREETYNKVLAGELPSNSLYGLVELQELGYHVSFKGDNHEGFCGKIIQLINKRFSLDIKCPNTLRDLINYDIIVVFGPISTLTTLVCKVFNKKIIYLNTLFVPPKNIVRKLIIKYNIKASDGVIVTSKAQGNESATYYNLPYNKFKFIPFCIDVKFCSCQNYKSSTKPFILSVGRDAARDYKTLVEAVKGVDIDLKIVTMPYLLNGIDIGNAQVEILNELPYKDLYELYSQALFVVIPLKKWGTTHTSGLTSLLEAKLLGKGVVSSQSKPLNEYFDNGNGVHYIEPENIDSLRQVIIDLLENPSNRLRLEAKGQEVVCENYNMYIFADAFGKYLEDVVRG